MQNCTVYLVINLLLKKHVGMFIISGTGFIKYKFHLNVLTVQLTLTFGCFLLKEVNFLE